MAEVDVFDIELQNNETPDKGPKNNSDSDDELLEIEEVIINRQIIIVIFSFFKINR